MNKQKKTSLSLKQRLRIIAEATENNKSELCAKYECSRSTLNRILQNQETILEKSKTCNMTSKRFRSGACPQVDQAITVWFKQMRASGAIVSSNMLLEKAKQFAIKMKQDFNPTAGWLWRWQKREGISLKKRHQEGSPTDVESANDFLTDVLPNLIKNYASNDIFNADESGLFYKALPPSSLYRNGHQISDFKFSKERLTLLFICNATGDYKKVIVVGKPKNPGCFKNKTIPLEYYSHKKAWMTQELWNEILSSLDKEMISQNRKIVLFVDNATSHKIWTALRNINIQFLPPNTTSIVQPLEQGIIHCFKSYYRQNIIRKQISAIERGNTVVEFTKSINIFNALHIIKHAWWMVEPCSITNCFKKTKLISKDDGQEEHDIKTEELSYKTMEDSPSNDFVDKDFQNYIRCDDNLMCCAQAKDEDIIDEVLPGTMSEDDMEADEEDDVYENTPSVQEALSSLNTLRKYLLSDNAFTSELESMEEYIVSKISNKNLQTKITNFFIMH